MIVGVEEGLKRNGGRTFFGSAHNTRYWDGLMQVYCRFNIVVLFVATVPRLHHIGHQGGGIGGGGLVDDFPGPHLSIINRQVKRRVILRRRVPPEESPIEPVSVVIVFFVPHRTPSLAPAGC